MNIPVRSENLAYSHIPLAEYKTIYDVADVDRAIEDKTTKNHGNEALTAMYESMREHGGYVLS